MKISDKVNIVSKNMQNLYGIKETDVFEIEDIVGTAARLKGIGWFINMAHLRLTPVYLNGGSFSVVPNDAIDLQALVDDKLAELVDEDMAFTAFDITKQLREENPDHVIKHYKVKEIVHNGMEGYLSYEKSLVDVGEDIQPWLYYPEGYDPDSYDSSRGAQILKLAGADVVSTPDPEDHWDSEGGNHVDVPTPSPVVAATNENVLIKFVKKLWNKV